MIKENLVPIRIKTESEFLKAGITDWKSKNPTWSPGMFQYQGKTVYVEKYSLEKGAIWILYNEQGGVLTTNFKWLPWMFEVMSNPFNKKLLLLHQ